MLKQLQAAVNSQTDKGPAYDFGTNFVYDLFYRYIKKKNSLQRLRVSTNYLQTRKAHELNFWRNWDWQMSILIEKAKLLLDSVLCQSLVKGWTYFLTRAIYGLIEAAIQLKDLDGAGIYIILLKYDDIDRKRVTVASH